LIDEAASSLRLAQESKPDELEALEREIMTMQIELESLKNESDVFSVERRQKVENDLKDRKERVEAYTELWQKGQNFPQLYLLRVVLTHYTTRTGTPQSHQGHQETP
jgi:ATP-dependent Clp protease ATP-binding subunit ClpA